jgi:sporulation integral membrane protein YtvI
MRKTTRKKQNKSAVFDENRAPHFLLVKWSEYGMLEKETAKEAIGMELEDLREERRRMHGRLLLRFGLILAILILCALCGSLLLSILLPLVAAYFLAGILNVPIKWLEKHFGATRNVGSVLISILLVAIVGTLIGAAVYRIYQEAVGFVANWDSMELDVITTLQDSGTRLASLLGWDGMEAAETIRDGIEKIVLWILQWLEARMEEWSFPAVEQAEGMVTGAVNFVISAIVFLLATFYMMTDYPHLHSVYARAVPETVQEKLRIVRTAAKKAFGGYFKAQVLLSGGIGVVTAITLTVYGQPFAVLIALLVCIMDFIPVLGTGTILIPWGCIVLLAGDLKKAAMLFILTFVMFLSRKVLEPKVVGDQTGLPTILALLCIYVGMVWGGVLGMIFVPALFLMVIEMKRGGFFDGMIADLRMLFEEIEQVLHSA